MNKIFLIFISVIILQRIVELYIAKNNERHMRDLGGVEVGAKHYKYIVMLHTFFFLALVTEVVLTKNATPKWWPIPFALFVLAQVLRVWCIKSLGRYWNTKIIILPGSEVVKKGPYKYLRHPNYLVVITELLVIPLMFGAFFTAFITTLLNAIILSIRIKTEESALGDYTGYEQTMKFIPKLLPSTRERIKT